MGSRLADLDFVALDCQSTGATPAHGALLELGWAIGHGEPEATLVRLPEGATLSRQVTRITGIRRRDLQGARPRDETWAGLERALEPLRRPIPAVIHFATFEERWLRELHLEQRPGTPFPFDPICTHAIAKRLLPDLPRRGLRALAGYFGAEVGRLRRSVEHVRATQLVWRALVGRLAAESVETLEDLRVWIDETPAGRPGARGFPMPAEERAGLPAAPGVYRMLRVDGSLLYIGKARCLKKRVRSYFHKKAKVPERTLEMLSQARRLEWTATPTALEAALLEQEQIKEAHPPYNVALRADERSCWFADRSLAELVEAPDDAHPIGPVTDPRLLAGLSDLRDALRGDPLDPEAVPFGAMQTWAPEPEAFAEGASRFRERHPGVPLTLRGLLGLGRALWPLERGPLDRDREEEEEADGWSPDGVADAIEDRWARAAHAIRRARWLTILSEASVGWSCEGRRRVLVLERGHVASRAWIDPGDATPCPPGHRRRAAARRACFDVRVRDRLRVLTTELRRAHREGLAPRVRTGPRSIVDERALGRLLAWV